MMDPTKRQESIEFLRTKTDPAVRALTPHHHIDPGFINRRKCFSVFGETFVDVFEKNKKPTETWPDSLRNNHLIVDMALRVCNISKVLPLGAIAQNPRVGQIFCSTEMLAGASEELVYGESSDRIRNQILLELDPERQYWLSFGREHFVADTGKYEQTVPACVAIIGEVRRVTPSEVEIHPLIMGAPSFDHPSNKDVGESLAWFGYDLYQLFPEDIDQFARIVEVDRSLCTEWPSLMSSLPEKRVKEKLALLLGDQTAKDWGGEDLDHYTTSVTVGGKRRLAGFLLKGPAKFGEMTMAMCGKNADQINRLAATPCDLLVLQHCHDVGLAVRETLRAFSVQPSRPRQYCVIDGRDTFRLFSAYGLI
ncbi:MAG: hypothetical protein ACREJO_01645 [Phycisphaerales bacterium]